jgi:hypothetical protein
MDEAMEEVDEDGFYALMRFDSRPDGSPGEGSEPRRTGSKWNGKGNPGETEGLSSVGEEVEVEAEAEEVRKKFQVGDGAFGLRSGVRYDTGVLAVASL